MNFQQILPGFQGSVTQEDIHITGYRNLSSTYKSPFADIYWDMGCPSCSWADSEGREGVQGFRGGYRFC